MKAVKAIGALVAIGGVVAFTLGASAPGSQGGYEAIGILAGCLGCLVFAVGRFLES